MNILLSSVCYNESIFQYKMSRLFRKEGFSVTLLTFSKKGYKEIKNSLKNDEIKIFYIEHLLKSPLKKVGKELNIEIINLEKTYNTNLRSIYKSDLVYNKRQKRNEKELIKLTIKYFHVIKDFLRKNKINFIFSGNGGELIRRVSIKVAKKQKIPYITNYFVPTGGVALVNNELYDLEIDMETKEQIPKKERKNILKYINKIRNAKISFLNDRNIKIDKKRFLTFFKLMKKTLKQERDPEQLPPFEQIKNKIGILIRKHVERLYYEKFDKNKNYIFFPLHYTDDAQITVRAPLFSNQLSLIEMISKSLPYGYSLYVRGHPNNLGFNPLSLYKKINKLSNVRLISPYIPPHEVIKNSKAMIVINSTAGYEGIIFQKPVIALGDSFYWKNGLTFDVKEINNLPIMISKAVNSPKINQESIIQFIYKLRKISYKGKSMSADYSNKNVAELTNSVLKKIEGLTSQNG